MHGKHARRIGVLALLGCLALSAPAMAQQSKLLFVSNGDELTADGNTVFGTILNSDVDGQLYRWTRGTAPVYVGPAIPSADGNLRLSDDGSVATWALYNGFTGVFNPAFGYYSDTVACCNGSVCTTTTIAGCTGVRLAGNSTCAPTSCPAPTGTNDLGACCNPTTAFCTITNLASCTGPNYWLANTLTCGSNPCRRGHFVTHSLDTTTGTWTNVGSFPNVAGQGAARCDGSIGQPWGISGNGQFIAGSGQFGAFGSTACSSSGFVYNSADGTMRRLPPTGTGCQIFSQGEYVSNDGLIAVGTDSQQDPLNPTGTCNLRLVAVWERPSTTSDFTAANRTVLAEAQGGLGSMVMTKDGTKIVANRFRGPLPTDAGNLAAWTKVSGVWTPTNLGKCPPPPGLPAAEVMLPRAISDDGNTIIGTAIFGGTSITFAPSADFIWRANVNGGVPMLLSEYIAQINGGASPIDRPISFLGEMSGNGNALLVRYFPASPVCPNPNTGLTELGRTGLLYLDGTNVPCEPPRVIGGPWDRAQEEYTQFGIVGNLWVAGSYPMTVQWQKEEPTGSGTWVNISDSCGTFSTDPVNPWIYEGTSGLQLRVNMLAPAAQRDGRYRAVVSNSCGVAISREATIGVVTGACCYTDSVSGQVVCTLELRNRCVGSPAISFFYGGEYLGDGSVCTPAACPGRIGACCYVPAFGSQTQCTLTLRSDCERVGDGGFGGNFAGAGTTCTTTAACDALSGACCASTDPFLGATCTITVPSHCNQSIASGHLAGVFRGAGTTCTPTACTAVTGACCYAPTTTDSVICTIQTQTRCTEQASRGGLQGVYFGNGQVCSPADLCSEASGACCYTPVNGTQAICTLQISFVCTAKVNGSSVGSQIIRGLSGVYRGDGTVCGPTTCTNFVGSCCYTPIGALCPTCAVTPQNRCIEATNIGGLGGTYGGPASVCGPTTCTASNGACCFGPSCSVTCQNECVVNGGDFRAGVLCEPDPCGVQTGRCCIGARCAIVLPTACVVAGQAGASFTASAQDCNAAGANASPCCFADYNKAGGVTVQDIFDFLTDYFTGSANANVGGDGVAAPTVQDIFDYLTAYFAGGC